MRSIVIGILFILGGLSGTLVLRGTGSGLALAFLGVVYLIIGIARMSAGSDGYRAEPSEADRERDAEQWAEYERAKAKLAARETQKRELEALLAATPAAKQTVDEVVERTKKHLSEDEQLALAIETAKRVGAEQAVAAT
jgi:hypothetical protein